MKRETRDAILDEAACLAASIMVLVSLFAVVILVSKLGPSREEQLKERQVECAALGVKLDTQTQFEAGECWIRSGAGWQLVPRGITP